MLTPGIKIRFNHSHGSVVEVTHTCAPSEGGICASCGDVVDD